MRRPRRSRSLLQLALCRPMWLSLVLPPAPAVAAPAPPAAPATAPVSASAAGAPALLATSAPAGTVPALGPAVTGIPGLPDGARELVARRTRTSRTYANPRGTLTTRSSLGSTNFQDATGTWQVIDNTLVPDATPGSAATNRANRYQVHLPTSLSAGPVKVTLGSLAVAFGLEGAGSSPAAIAGSVARYANALPGVSVAYAAASDRVEEALTLASPAAPHTFVYSLAASGLTAHANAHGGIDFLDAKGTVQFAFLAPVMEDAAHARSSALALSLSSDATGSTVTLTADAAWLANPARRYPVVVDPALVTTTGDSQDCPIDSAYPTTIYCGSSYLAAGANGAEVARSLLQFPLALRGEVLGATVGLYQFAAGTTTPQTLELHQLTRPFSGWADWATNDGFTPWTTPGGDYVATATSTVADAGTAANGTWLRFAATAPARGWNAGSQPNDGVIIKTASEGTTQSFSFCPGGGRGRSTAVPRPRNPTSRSPGATGWGSGPGIPCWASA